MENVLYILRISSIIIAIAAIIGNALVCHVIVRLRTMKTCINYIILSLAILDAITGCITIYNVFTKDIEGLLGEPVLPQAYNQSSILAEVMCRIELCYWLPVGISPLLLMIMAYERFKAIVHPFSRLDGTVSKARLKWLLPLAWFCGTLFVVGDIPFVKYDKNLGLCQHDKQANYVAQVIFNLAWLIVSYVIPSTAMLIFYGRVICALRKQDNALGLQAEAERARRQEKRKKVMWVVIVVTLVYYICCGIPQVFYAFGVTYFPLKDRKLLKNLIVLPLALNSALNPLVYFIFIQAFRDGFRRVFMARSLIVPSNNELKMEDRPQQ